MQVKHLELLGEIPQHEEPVLWQFSGKKHEALLKVLRCQGKATHQEEDATQKAVAQLKAQRYSVAALLSIRDSQIPSFYIHN